MKLSTRLYSVLRLECVELSLHFPLCLNETVHNYQFYIRISLSLFRSMYPHSPRKIFHFSLIYLFSFIQLLPGIMVNKFQTRSTVYGLTLVCGHCASIKNINADWPTFHTFPAECQCSAARCITAYLWCCCYMQASTLTSSPSICAQCK